MGNIKEFLKMLKNRIISFQLQIFLKRLYNAIRNTLEKITIEKYVLLILVLIQTLNFFNLPKIVLDFPMFSKIVLEPLLIPIFFLTFYTLYNEIPSLFRILPKDFFEKELFCWEKVPGDDNGRILNFLKSNLKIEWVDNAEIKKSDDGKVITITNGENSLMFTQNEGNKINLEINGKKTYECISKKENSTLKVCLKKYKEMKYMILIAIMFAYLLFFPFITLINLSSTLITVKEIYWSESYVIFLLFGGITLYIMLCAIFT